MVICSAVRVKLVEGKFPYQDFTFQGLRHRDCYRAMQMAGIHTDDVLSRQEGFMTHKGIFLSREAAFVHCVEFGQLAPSIARRREQEDDYKLSSEDLY